MIYSKANIKAKAKTNAIVLSKYISDGLTKYWQKQCKSAS